MFLLLMWEINQRSIMLTNSLARTLLVHGTILFLLGLLNGLIVQQFLNPRMGLSAHLAGVQNALVLWAFGLMWAYVGLRRWLQLLAAWSAIFSMYAIWLGLLLAAVWGASGSVPIAGAGYSASSGKELAVTTLIVTGSVAIIIAAIFVLYGLLRTIRRDPIP